MSPPQSSRWERAAWALIDWSIDHEGASAALVGLVAGVVIVGAVVGAAFLGAWLLG